MNTSLDSNIVAHSLRLLLVFGTCIGLSGCGQDPGASADDLITLSSPGVDRFGCPIVQPSPFVASLEYVEFCGDGCAPLGAVDMQDGSDWFVACVSDEISRPVSSSDVTFCLTGPEDNRDYQVADTEDATVLASLCWIPCEADSVSDPGLDGWVPDYCLE
ncbi:MAG: hypothetical protein WCF10_09480 [Polyangiales bacterium]